MPFRPPAVFERANKSGAFNRAPAFHPPVATRRQEAPVRACPKGSRMLNFVENFAEIPHFFMGESTKFATKFTTKFEKQDFGTTSS
jgi:hypothetical protein